MSLLNTMGRGTESEKCQIPNPLQLIPFFPFDQAQLTALTQNDPTKLNLIVYLKPGVGTT